MLCVCFACLRLVYMLPVSQNCPFLIGPSVFSNVYIDTYIARNIKKKMETM